MNDSKSKKPQQILNKVRLVEIEEDRAGQRIDNFLLSQLKGVPKSRIYRIVRKGEVRVNKGRVKVEYKLKAGDIVRIPPIRVAEAKELAKPSEQLREHLSAAVLYEDDRFMVMNKPSGLAVHGGSGINLGLIESMRQLRPECRYLELVHRLDKDTSGCIMIAKKRSMLRYLHAQLRSGGIQKYYHALVVGHWSSKRRQVDEPLCKNEKLGEGRIVRVAHDGKPSLTRFKVLQHYKDCTLVEAKPITGRTHQIRVHAQCVGHSLVGDPKYGDTEANKSMKGLGFNRLFLHAASLEFLLPDTEELFKVSAPLDERLAVPLASLKKEVG